MDEEVLKGKVLLVVDDENDLRDIVASELEFMGAEVHQAENISNAQKILAQKKVDLIISDIRMPGGTGIDLLDAVKLRDSDIPPVILITGFADITVEDAFNKGAEALVSKPFKLDDLIKMVVRYTSPFETRFKEEGTAVRAIHPVKNGIPLKFGRGGLSLPIETDGKRIDIGELVNFEFDFDNHHYSGVGACRWLKPIEQGSNKAMMGLEFMSLQDEGLKIFRKFAEGKKVVPYIPYSKN